MNRFTNLFDAADAAFNKHYSEELKQLKGLSEEEISKILPSTTDFQIYNELIKIVENASQENLAQADLADKIKSLGNVAVNIAKKVPGLNAIL
ncbi:hypothetical protein [Phocaeicola plebeius]|uniref:hypothetical protein n=1 Tax=Phocaeicola plebeius TaxID=310297 RepID=UPI0022DECDDC|nr:hypothetical protein [Phocaeicola plebeius]